MVSISNFTANRGAANRHTDRQHRAQRQTQQTVKPTVAQPMAFQGSDQSQSSQVCSVALALLQINRSTLLKGSLVISLILHGLVLGLPLPNQESITTLTVGETLTESLSEARKQPLSLPLATSRRQIQHKPKATPEAITQHSKPSAPIAPVARQTTPSRPIAHTQPLPQSESMVSQDPQEILSVDPLYSPEVSPMPQVVDEPPVTSPEEPTGLFAQFPHAEQAVSCDGDGGDCWQVADSHWSHVRDDLREKFSAQGQGWQELDLDDDHFRVYRVTGQGEPPSYVHIIMEGRTVTYVLSQDQLSEEAVRQRILLHG